MSSKAMSLKGKIKNYAKRNNIAAQVVLQNYMFECFLSRLSASEYRDKFVIKGGMLIAAIVGLDTRSTMDLDTTLRNLPLTEEKISEAVNEICKIDMKDDVTFAVKSIAPIRKDDIYGGYCVRMDDVYILGTTQGYDKEIYKDALKATAKHRGSTEQISDTESILKQISESDDLKEMWRKYQKKFLYVNGILYEDILEVLKELV